jgi:chorismate lyase/3-hydroxybenzoate synthase
LFSWKHDEISSLQTDGVPVTALRARSARDQDMGNGRGGMSMQAGLNLDYVHEGDLEACVATQQGRLLGIVGFGATPLALGSAMQREVRWVRIPVLGGQAASFEVWASRKPVTSCGQGNIRAATDGDVLFGSMELEQRDGASLEALARQAYTELFAFMDSQGHRNLLRVWNYVPRINEAEGGLERYRCFNLGRHEGFRRSGRDISEENVPAASVLGCYDGPMVIYFLASKSPGTPINNPRQMAAYRYPEQYGPRSPIFVRAMLANLAGQRCLLVSGTASIVGHETVHKGDVQQQTEETLRNMRTLLQQAWPDGMASCSAARMRLKAYVRHAGDMAQIRECVEREFGSPQDGVYLQSDICRTDLLLEIEGVWFCEAAS